MASSENQRSPNPFIAAYLEGRTLQQVASELGVGRKTVWRWKWHERNPNHLHLHAMLRRRPDLLRLLLPDGDAA